MTTSKRKKESGKSQIASEVSPGLRAAVLAQKDKEGVSASTIVRKALMVYLNVDANGKPAGKRNERRV